MEIQPQMHAGMAHTHTAPQHAYAIRPPHPGRIDPTTEPTVEREAAPAPAVETAATTQRMLQATQTGTAQTAAVQIRTREGDLVNVSISRLAASAELSAVSEGEFGYLAGSARAAVAAISIDYSVDGDLDKREQKAIDRLLHRVEEIADRFFSGNIQAGFQQASHLGIKGSQLATFSFTLSQRSVYQAVTEYQSVAQPESPRAAAVETLAEYAGELQDLAQDPELAAVVPEPLQAIADVLNAQVDLRAAADFSGVITEGALTLLRDLIAHLLSADDTDAKPAMASEADVVDNAAEQVVVASGAEATPPDDVQTSAFAG